MRYGDDFWAFGEETPGESGAKFNPDTITLSMRDEAGAVHQITIGDLAQQFNAASAEMIGSWEQASTRDLMHTDIEIAFKDRAAPLKENFLSFLDRHRDEIALFQIATETPQMLRRLRGNPRYSKYDF